MKLPITLCLYTSTKGHYGRKDIYKTTVDSILSHLPVDQWGGLVASLKYDNSGHDTAREMIQWLSSKQFAVYPSFGTWSHHNDSHQIEYLNDHAKINNRIRTAYVLHLEDDWIIKSYDREFRAWLDKAVNILESNPQIVQVRFPRFTNECERILALRQKFGFDSKCIATNEECFLSNDWSNNPYVARTRDIRGALTIIDLAGLPRHSEHGLGAAMKNIGWGETPLLFFNPKMVRCGHIGCKTGEEDNLDLPNISD